MFSNRILKNKIMNTSQYITFWISIPYCEIKYSDIYQYAASGYKYFIHPYCPYKITLKPAISTQNKDKISLSQHSEVKNPLRQNQLKGPSISRRENNTTLNQTEIVLALYQDGKKKITNQT